MFTTLTWFFGSRKWKLIACRRKISVPRPSFFEQVRQSGPVFQHPRIERRDPLVRSSSSSRAVHLGRQIFFSSAFLKRLLPPRPGAAFARSVALGRRELLPDLVDRRQLERRVVADVDELEKLRRSRPLRTGCSATSFLTSAIRSPGGLPATLLLLFRAGWSSQLW